MNKYELGFSVSNLGPKSFQKVLNKFGTPERGWKATKEEYEKIGIGELTYKNFDEFRNGFDVVNYTGQLARAGVDFVSFSDERYPKSLKSIDNPPIGLYCKGNVSLLKDSSPPNSLTRVGVVGTRKITQYGRDVTSMLVSGLVTQGVVIVSGLALGVDGLSHRVTLDNQGVAIAVLACGVDCCTPSENYSLYSRILKQNGLVISEYPLSCPPNKGTFLARNRIVAALSDGIVVTEAAEDSGSLVTADWGFKLNKKIFAVPGAITSRMSDGSLKLLKQGATLVTDAEDVLKEFKVQNAKLKIKSRKFKNLNADEKKIISLLEGEALTIDEIAKETGLPVSKLFVVVSRLELSGFINNKGGKINLNS